RQQVVQLQAGAEVALQERSGLLAEADPLARRGQQRCVPPHPRAPGAEIGQRHRRRAELERSSAVTTPSEEVKAICFPADGTGIPHYPIAAQHRVYLPAATAPNLARVTLCL